MQDQLDRIEAKVDRMEDYIWRGNGREALTVRMDRIEQTERKRTWWARTWAGAAVAALVASTASLINGGNH